MPPPPHAKPENVAKRAQELIGVGQSQAALSLLHEHVTSKRTRSSPIASLEPVMLLFVELCVDLRKGKSAKDGLYQYKNTAQNTNVGTIELVLKKFIELAEAKVTEAQAKADEVQSSLESTNASANVEDLEASETPESILLSTVSGEQSRDRTDRAIVTPWLKFLWETYRTVLDILKNNARLEVMYQTTAHQAFQFCQKYARKTEFRRLCELLRNHLQNAAKYSAQMHAINLSDPDTLQRHLGTRFQQLNVAVELELWQEAFRSVEDIHTLLNLSKRPAKNIMMANYFEKLTRIFLVSENYLFHAAAWSRYFNLLRQSAAAVASGASLKKDNPSVTEADMTKAASFVLLSALAIPVISTSRSRGALQDVDEARRNKNSRLTNLLGMPQAPTRASLFKDALSKGLLKRARPEIRELYNILEVDFHPLSICRRISPILSQIGADPEMEKYILPLQQVILTRLFQQLSQVYESVELKFVLELAQFPEPFQVNASTIEKFIMNGCKKGDLAIRVDHATGVLTFDSDVFSSAKALHPGSGAGSAENETSAVQRLQSTPAEIVRSQLTRLAKSLFVTCQYVDPTFNEDRRKAKEAALIRAREGGEQEHQATLARREIIQKKKEAASSALAQKEKDEATRRRLRQQQLQQEETERLAAEQRERDERRRTAERERVQREEMQRQINELKQGVKGVNLDELDLTELDTGRIRALKIRALEKEKNDLEKKLETTSRRIDHLERAFRQEERKHLSEDYTKQRERDLAVHEKKTKEDHREAERKHREDVSLRNRVQRLVPTYEDFKKQITAQRAAEFERRRRQAQKELEQKMEARKREVRERKARERREQEERERAEREEEERRIQEEEEKARAEEEKKQKQAEDRAKREEERKRLDEVAAKQRQREAEAEERRKKAKDAPPTRPIVDRPALGGPEFDPPTAAPLAAGAGAGGPPRLALAGSKPSWRDRQAAKDRGDAAPPPAAADADASSTPPPAPASDVPTQEADLPKRTGYVPPHLRGGDRSAGSGSNGASPAPERGGRWQRSESPNPSAAGPGGSRYQAPGARGGGAYRPPGQQRRGGEDGERDESPAPAPASAETRAPTQGKYRPGAFAQRRAGGT
ncbi:MAG: eukaryotic translation initiation factor 3 subunit A [Bathelium mastoideum]|nr:MAG: eukaryotic translation initiation factor 3 subunit A [Bathelium mastoideum]